ncbi:MAG: hypothetical protein JXL97_09965 [Bacteroidales bacterium]|nr:hypothetical protein [Bacteroidales bacterium]
MNKLILFVLVSIFLGCSSNNANTSNDLDIENITIELKDTINLNGSPNLVVEKGQLLYYDFEALPSADLRSEFSISDDKIVKHQKTEQGYVNYNSTDDGSDRIKGKYIFKAIKKGKTILTFTVFLHGEIQNETKIEIEVN